MPSLFLEKKNPPPILLRILNLKTLNTFITERLVTQVHQIWTLGSTVYCSSMRTIRIIGLQFMSNHGSSRAVIRGNVWPRMSCSLKQASKYLVCSCFVWYCNEQWSFHFEYRPRQEVFFYPEPSRQILVPTQPPIQWAPKIFPAVKRPEREDNLLSATCAKVRISWSLPTSCADCLESLEPQLLGTPRACPGLQWESFTLITILLL
jgi:hypothetical protein